MGRGGAPVIGKGKGVVSGEGGTEGTQSLVHGEGRGAGDREGEGCRDRGHARLGSWGGAGRW